jgi:hypothetical protein
VVKEFSALIPEDRKFEVGGEVYEWVTPFWKDLALIFDEDVMLIAQAAIDAAKAEDEQDDAPKEGDDTQTRDNIERVQTRIMLFLAPADHPRWKKLCGRKEDPVPMFLFNEVYRWLLEVATGRPTLPPSDSAPGVGNGGPSSQVASPSRAARRRR